MEEEKPCIVWRNICIVPTKAGFLKVAIAQTKKEILQRFDNRENTNSVSRGGEWKRRNHVLCPNQAGFLQVAIAQPKKETLQRLDISLRES